MEDNTVERDLTMQIREMDSESAVKAVRYLRNECVRRGIEAGSLVGFKIGIGVGAFLAALVALILVGWAR
jgi:hypothetical protein